MKLLSNLSVLFAEHYMNNINDSSSKPCTWVHRDILSRNGSAVDAAVAALFCNGVVNMQSMGLGGGFMMTVYDRATKTAHALVARETAPSAATKYMFSDNASLSLDGKPD